MPEENVYWYVLFVRTGAEERVAKRLKNELGSDGYFPFVPKKTCVFRRQGKRSLFQKICFPGYVFVESDKPTREFLKYVWPVVYKVKDAYRFLYYGDKADIAMRDEERIILSSILGADKRIDISKGFKEGDEVEIISGALAGNKSIIKKINRNRSEAVLEILMFETVVSVSVGLEVIDK